MEQLKELPHHDIPTQVNEWLVNPTLRIMGLVAAPQTLTAAELASDGAILARTDFTDDFLCDGKRTIGDIVDVLAAKYAAERDLIGGDVIAMLEDLRGRDFLVVVEGD